MSRRVRHIYAKSNEYIKVHRGSSSGGCLEFIGTILGFLLFLWFLSILF